MFVAINIVKFLTIDDSITLLIMHWKSILVTHDIYNLIHDVDEDQDVFKPLTSQTMWSEYIYIYIYASRTHINIHWCKITYLTSQY